MYVCGHIKERLARMLKRFYTNVKIKTLFCQKYVMKGNFEYELEKQNVQIKVLMRSNFDG
jgi:hypothetical protein